MSHQNNPSVSITNSTTSFSMPTTFSSPIKQEFPNNLISLQQHPDFCEIPRDISNSSLDRRRSSGSITLLSNYEDSRHDLIKDGESSGHYSSFGAQNNKIVPSNMRLSQGNNSINTKNCNQVGGFIIPKEEQQCGNTSVPDKEKQKQTKKENTSVGFGGIEEKPIHDVIHSGIIICDACGKRLCSSRSLKRHKSTCKKVKAEIEQNQDSGGFIVSPPLSKPVTENISEAK
ncbi:hypothetical protein Mgra_00001921 [Meloidogyne graminicola]|uniref:C2H2-type domain-containing protein n=1 Tax=Meloidogyne graminicola TaxID=189291 RepID=A0A8S9ZXS1_9BILA|nr:hypothetical protein Mgra_00001921 [Meloidogyne graminicola]